MCLKAMLMCVSQRFDKIYCHLQVLYLGNFRTRPRTRVCEYEYGIPNCHFIHNFTRILSNILFTYTNHITVNTVKWFRRYSLITMILNR